MARTHKLEYLGKNKRLVAPVVSAEARWSRTGGWQAAVRAVGKLVLAIILAYVGYMLASLVGGVFNRRARCYFPLEYEGDCFACVDIPKNHLRGNPDRALRLGQTKEG
jgi:hypothetical protein